MSTDPSSQMPDIIEIRRLKVRTWIGVPDEERAAAQTIFITLRMTPLRGFEGLEDNIARTVNYHQVALQIEELAAARPRHLIETLVIEIADFLLGNHPLQHVAATIEKHILPNTECVAVHVERNRP